MSDTDVTAVERHAAALARDLAWWKNLLTTRTNTLRARAEKAEAERDALQAKLDLPCGSCHPCTNWAAEVEHRRAAAFRSLVRKMAAVIADMNTEHEACIADVVWDACGSIGEDLTGDEACALTHIFPIEDPS